MHFDDGTSETVDAIILGSIAGIVMVYGVDLLEWLRIDDPVGAWPVHGVAGIWGTLSLGLLACGKYGASGPTGADDSSPVTGLFYGGGTQLLVAQIIGSASITAATFGVSMIMFYALKMAGTLRVSKEGELEGLDAHEHGGSAYPELMGGGGGSVSVSSTHTTGTAAAAVAE